MSSAFERLQKLAQQKKEQEKPKLEIVGKESQPHQPNQPNVDNQPNQPKISGKLKTQQPVAPKKDFTKVPNSVSRNAVPERLFRGMSKNTYDALYLKTRGAVNPIRKIRATKSDLIRWTGVSDVTLDKHLKHLKSVGLVDWEFIIGSHDGNWYEVFVPEETDLTNLTNLTNPNPDNQPKKVGGDITNLVGDVGGVQAHQNKEFSQTSKTIFKTSRNDDEVFVGMTSKLSQAVVKLTGKNASKIEAEKWEALADLLILELEVAASRTGSISSVPAFLTEVLRRQFFAARSQKSEKPSSAKTSAIKPDKVGKSDVETFEIKPLDEPGREAALEQLREFANEPFLEDFRKWYTPEDWQWLTEKLKTDVSD